MIFLVLTAQLHWRWLPERRTRIYRLVELVGRWSMLDIYVITILVALVQFNALATIKAGPGAIAFGAVVVLTMFAAMSFDPRLIWDAMEPDHVRPPRPPELPEAVATRRSRWRMQLVWLVPLVAVLIGGWLAVQSILEKGPTITISFATGEGLEAGKTKIKFKNVDIGVVKSVTLSPDHKCGLPPPSLSNDATNMLVDDTRFWVVRPRISGGTVSGIGTLLSGSFIGMDVGTRQQGPPRFRRAGVAAGVCDRRAGA